MSTLAYALPRMRAATGGPRERVREAVRDWWAECKAIIAAACPFIPVPSPVREALALLD
ncbi:MAG: hypothetical protein HYX33_01220 [Actinobacteria bacterium]|nr:hypothetical protein [Actinomycetota bacterium]